MVATNQAFRGGMSEHTDRTPDGAQSAMFDMINGYWRTQIVCAAAELGIADLLANGPQSIQALANSAGVDEASLYRLMRALVGFGVFTLDGDGRYETTDLGRCLESDAPGRLRARAVLTGKLWYPAWAGLLEGVRSGSSTFEHVVGLPLFDHLNANPDIAAAFHETMQGATRDTAQAVTSAYDFSSARTVIDIGGGTGALLAGVLAQNPQATGIVFDTPDVAPRARNWLAGEGLSDRCTVVAGDFFEAVPAGGDVYMLSWVIHDWDDDQAVTILDNCRRAMDPDARLLLVEQLIPSGSDHALANLYDLHMLMVAGGRERRQDEYAELLAASGLQLTRCIPTNGPRSVIEASTLQLRD